MDPVTAGKTAEFLQASGPWGLIAVCFAVIGLLWRDSVALRQQIAALHEQRVKEVAALAASTASGLTTSSSAISANTLAAESTNRLLQQVLDVARPIAPAVEITSRQIEATGLKIDRLLERGDRP